MSEDLLQKPETKLDLDLEGKEEMPSPLPNPSSKEGVMVNGGESNVFVEPHKPDGLPKDELRTLVRQQLEYYFSRFVP